MKYILFLITLLTFVSCQHDQEYKVIDPKTGRTYNLVTNMGYSQGEIITDPSTGKNVVVKCTVDNGVADIITVNADSIAQAYKEKVINANKSLLSWSLELPKPLREQYVVNLLKYPHYEDAMANNLSEALQKAFPYNKTPEGESYWRTVETIALEIEGSNGFNGDYISRWPQ